MANYNHIGKINKAMVNGLIESENKLNVTDSALKDTDEQIKADVQEIKNELSTFDSNAITTHIADNEIHISESDRMNWNSQYTKPIGGIPKTDLATDLQTSLTKADSALQATEADKVNWNNKINSSEKGVANGVATLNSEGKVVDATGSLVEGKVTSVNNKIGDVSLSATDVGAETPLGSQTKANTALTEAKAYTDTKSNEAVNSAKSYTDDLISSVTESGVPSLANYPYILTAASNGQLDYEIPLETFNKNIDALALVVLNRTTLDINDFSITDNITKGRTLTLLVDVSEISTGDTIYILILKNAPVGTEGSFSGSYLTNDSVTKTKLSPALRSELDSKADKTTSVTSVNGQIGDVVVQGFSGDYVDLTNKPTIPSAASQISTAAGTTVQVEIDSLKSSVSDGKQIIATAITDKNVPTNGSDSFQVMADKIALIETGSDVSGVTAIAGDVISGKTIVTSDGALVDGTLALSGNATVAQVLSGQTFYSTDPKTKLIGTMANRGSIGTVTPSTAIKSYSAGYYNAFNVAGSSSLVASNIRSGVNVFGVTGTYTGNFFESSKTVYASYQNSRYLTLNTSFNVGFSPKRWLVYFWGLEVKEGSYEYNVDTMMYKTIGEGAFTGLDAPTRWLNGSGEDMNDLFDNGSYASGNTMYLNFEFSCHSPFSYVGDWNYQVGVKLLAW